uniref:Reverse transcriptase domain-containing protein n=1 Tax=Tanacetum cinerariifolium TaxID=118510 RepID=A0A699HCB8_TANCI|nr:hypothetical protein [Tanacetum cinerariifolium]
MGVLLAKERILKLIQDWDEKQIKSWSLSESLLQLSNDLRTIDEMLKQRKEKRIEREQAANLVVQEKQEEHAAQSFTPYWNSLMIDDVKVLQARENLMKAIQTFLNKFNHYPFGLMPKVLSISWERFSEIKHAFTDKQYQPEEIQGLMRKLLKDVRNINKELSDHTNSSSWNRPMINNDYEHSIQYSTILETESDELIKSSVKNLVLIPSEYEVTSDNESECDVPVNDEYSPIFTTFSNPIFDCNDDFTSSDDEYFIDSSPKFDYLLELAHIDPIPPRIEEADSDLEEEIRLVENLSYDNSSPRLQEELNAKIADMIVESLSPSPIPVEDSDSRMEENDLFLSSDDLMPPGIENDDYDSKRDIHFLEELLSNDPLPLPKNESFNFDHYDEPSFPRPPPKPSDVEGGGEIDVFENVKDDDYFPFIFVIPIFLSYLIYPEVSPLLLSTGSEDIIFGPGIST